MEPKDLVGIEVLIVEDSPTQTLLLQEALQEKKLKVFAAKDGVEGLEMVQKQKPQIVLSDISMPRMDGYEFCRQLKANPAFKEIPVLLLTSLTDPMDVIRGIACGADSFLTKPYEMNVLLTTMADCLENKSLLKNGGTRQQLKFSFEGKNHTLDVNPPQVTNLLLSTYSNAIQKNRELEQAYRKLSDAHQELARKNAELEQLNTQKNQFLGMAAHDLRNPLSVIAGYSGMIIDKNPTSDPENLKMLERIRKSSSFMLQLVNDLLDISSIESGKISLHLTQVNLPSLVKENIAFNTPAADKKQINILFNSPAEMPLIECDPDKIEQILTNLITNAIKFSHAGSSIIVELINHGNEILLSIKDSGIGISPEAKERLFTPFAKTGAKGTAGEGSTGLGLAIVKKVINEHRGKIWAESEVGKGSTFFVTLPIKQS